MQSQSPIRLNSHQSKIRAQRPPRRREAMFRWTSCLLLLAGSAHATHICGNYCGPNWCNGMDLSEESCDESVPVETHSLTGPSCADSCCKMHDACCASDDRPSCNTRIVDCLSHCDPVSATCTRDGIPVPAGAIEAAMDIVESWCCGSKCPSSSSQGSSGSSASAPSFSYGDESSW